jgi:hypothetical protein
VIPELKAIWATIEKEKQEGYSHRGPKKGTIKVKKLTQPESDAINLSVEHPQCFINTTNL